MLMRHARPDPRYRLAVLDFDGTLADTLPWFLAILDELADRFEIHLPRPLDVEAMRDLSAREILTRLGVPAWKLPLIARFVHARAAQSEIALFSGIPDLLAALRARGVALAVVSSNGEAAVRGALGAEAAAFVDRFACGAALFGKARVFRSVVRAMRVAASDVVCIGDEIRDGEAARKAGLAFGAVAWGYNRPEALARTGPVFVAERVADLVDLVAGPVEAAASTSA